MTISILQTKLHIPPARHGLVSRPRLHARGDEGAARKLTLISAPAGFGKTTLQVAAFPQRVTLVLDDLHVITHEEIHTALAFLLAHQPANLHLLVATRTDPPLPLARLRARHQMAEIRAADLRFAPEEAAVFLNQSMGLHWPPPAVAALEVRTEGWAAGLQLAALARLAAANLFVTPLDPRREWFRAHPFFADFLRARLARASPDRLPALHRRAADWYAAAGLTPEAIHHALAGRHYPLAADLIESIGRVHLGRLELNTLHA
ncbi:MAG: hypothetical protein ACE5GO_00060 [Anaerolineales bacterium]